MEDIKKTLQVLYERKWHEISQYGQTLAQTNYKKVIRLLPITTPTREEADFYGLGLWESYNKYGNVQDSYPRKQWDKKYDIDRNANKLGIRVPFLDTDITFKEDGSIVLRNEVAVLDQFLQASIGRENTLDKDVFDYILSNPLTPDGIALIASTHWRNSQKVVGETFSNRLTTSLTDGVQDALLDAFNVMDIMPDASGIPMVNNRAYYKKIFVGPKWYDRVVNVVATSTGASGIAGEQNVQNKTIVGQFETVNVPYYTGAYADFYHITREPKEGLSTFQMVTWGSQMLWVEEVTGKTHDRFFQFKGRMIREIGCRNPLWIVGYIG